MTSIKEQLQRMTKAEIRVWTSKWMSDSLHDNTPLDQEKWDLGVAELKSRESARS